MLRRTNLFWVTQFRKWFSTCLEQQSLIPLLNSCAQRSDISQIHAHIIKNGHDQIPFFLSKFLASSSILDIEYAASVFNQIENPNLFMFNSMLRGYSVSSIPTQGLLLFKILRAQGVLTDQFSFICVLKCCARGLAVNTGRAIHGLVVLCGLEIFINVRNTLLRFYGACWRIEDAHQLFDEVPQERDLVSWNNLIGTHLHVAQPSVAIDLFKQMRVDGFDMSNATILSGLSACADLQNLFCGQSLHGHCIKTGFCSDPSVVTAIIAVYAKNGRIDYGRQMFDESPKRDLVSWNCVIDGYAKNGRLDESLNLLQLMKLNQVRPNSATLAGVLSTCASSGALAIGKCIHKYIEEESLEVDVVLGTALIDMYSKCGFFERAVDVFDKMQSKDVKSWTAMITAYGLHGKGVEAIQLLNMMEASGLSPNEVTYLAVLIACSHGGLVEEGKNCFKRMVRAHGFSPNIEHYGCMIDLLGRAGLLQEAYELLKSLPTERDATAWRALLAACRVHGNVELGKTVKRALVDLGAEHPTDSILLSSAYAVAERWDDVARMRELEEEKRMKKEVGSSLIEMDLNSVENKLISPLL